MVVFGDPKVEMPQESSIVSGKSRRLHNFLLPQLKWGNQRILKCMKVDQNKGSTPLERRSSPSDAQSEDIPRKNETSSSQKRRSPLIKNEDEVREIDEGIEEVRAKLMAHLSSAANNTKITVPDQGIEKEEYSAKPWNLRTRRAACKAPYGDDHPKYHSSSSNFQYQPQINAQQKNLSVPQALAKKEKCLFSISLTKEEITEDFIIFKGSKPRRRPKKRSKIIQKQLDAIFPGLWLSEITVDTYKVPDDSRPSKQ